MPLRPARAARRGVIGAPVARTAATVGTAAVVVHGVRRRGDRREDRRARRGRGTRQLVRGGAPPGSAAPPTAEEAEHMAPEFAGRIELDIRDSTPDWAPYLAPKAPDGAPNVVFIVWDDVGYGTMDCFGGPVHTPTMTRIANMGVKYSNFHTTALCSPTRASLLTGRNATSNGMATIAEFSSGFPGISTRIPFENGFISAVLVEHGYNTYCVGKWHLTPGEETGMAASKKRWPLGRGFERF